MTTKKKLKKRGDPVIMRTKKNEPEYIMEWLNEQSNLSESLRYLIEQYVSENGVRDVREDVLNRQPGGLSVKNKKSNFQPYKRTVIEQPQKESEVVPEVENHEEVNLKEEIDPHMDEVTDTNVVVHEQPIIDKTQSELNKKHSREEGESGKRPVRKRQMDINNW